MKELGRSGCPNLWIRTRSVSGRVGDEVKSVSESESELEVEDDMDPSRHDRVEMVTPGERFERRSLPPRKALGWVEEGWMMAMRSPESTVGVRA